MFSPDDKNKLVAGMVGTISGSAVYAMAAWLGANLLHQNIWHVLGILLLARLCIAILDGFTGILSWRVYGRRRAVRGFLHVLQANQFPPRFYMNDDFLNYLARIEDESFSESVKRAAREFEQVLGVYESIGILSGARMHSASEAALEKYSPRSGAPVLYSN